MFKSSSVLLVVVSLMLGLFGAVCAVNESADLKNVVDQLKSGSFNKEATEVDTLLGSLLKIGTAYKQFGFDAYKLYSLRDFIECPKWKHTVYFADVFDDVKQYPNLKNYAMNRFARFLDKCGFEGQFSDLVSYASKYTNLKWNSEDNPTLLSYLTGEFREQAKKFKIKEPENHFLELDWAVSLVNDIASLTKMTEQNCSNEVLLDKIVLGLTKSWLHYRELFKLVAAPFIDYLEFCGLESKFKDAMGTIGIKLPVSKSPFYKYLIGEFWKQVYHNYFYEQRFRDGKSPKNQEVVDTINKNLVFAVSLVGQLEGLRKIEDPNCQERKYTTVLRDYWRATDEEYPKLFQYVDYSLRERENLCKNSFKRIAGEFKQNEKENWKSIEYLTLTAIKKLNLNPPERIYYNDGGVARSITEARIDLRKNYPNENVETRLQGSCDAFLDKVWFPIFGFCVNSYDIASSKDLAKIVEDKEILKYLLSAELCMEISKKYSRPCDVLFESLHDDHRVRYLNAAITAF